MDHNFIWTDQSIKRNQLTRAYEPVQPHLFIELLRAHRCRVVFDIGANIGYYALASTSAECVEEIFAFEAAPETFKHLERNCRLNRLDTQISCYNRAVSDNHGTVDFCLHGEDLSGINSVRSTTFHDGSHFISTVGVETLVIDDDFALKDQSIALKIDVEGHELEVLAGCEELLRRNNCVIQVEAYRDNKERAHKVLSRLGYNHILAVESDLYYVKTEFASLGNYKDFVSRAMSSVVQAGRKSHLESSVFRNINVDARLVGDSVLANCVVDHAFFEGNTEYAFYLHVDGKRRDIIWYSSDPQAVFKLPKPSPNSKFRVTAFARQKDLPERKLSKSIKL